MSSSPRPLPEPELEIDRVLRNAAELRSDAAEPAPPDPSSRKRVDVILDLAMRLFNQEGVAGISTNRIASELGISPGNMHYHYRTKGDLLQAAFRLLDQELRGACAKPPAILGVVQFVDWQVNVQRVLWRHRYFFGSLEVVIKTAPQLRIPWLELQSSLVAELAAIHSEYVQTGTMIPPNPPNTIPQVAQNGLMLWMSWIRWEFLAIDGRDLTNTEENAVINRLVWHHISFYEPYHVRSRRASDAIVRALEERLLAD